MGYNPTLAMLTESYLESQGWHYDSDRENGHCIFDFGMNLKSRLKSCHIFVDVKNHGILTLAVAPLKADDDTRDNVVEFITRANYGMINGCFEFDYRDGEVRFRTFLQSKHSDPDLKDIESSVDLPILMMERYGNGLVKNILGFGSPEADIVEIEG